MPTTEDTLKPCPFCGALQCDLEIHVEHSDEICVRCGYCGAKGESCGTIEMAKEMWNTRTSEMNTPRVVNPNNDRASNGQRGAL